MPTCPECDGAGKWQRNEERIFCSICHGAGALTEEKLTGYTARKLLETKFQLEEIVDPAPENLSRIRGIRETLQRNLPPPPTRYRVSAWVGPPASEIEKMFKEAANRGISYQDLVAERKLLEDKKNGVGGFGSAAAVLFFLGLVERYTGFPSWVSTWTLIVGVGFLIWSLHDYLTLRMLLDPVQGEGNRPRL